MYVPTSVLVQCILTHTYFCMQEVIPRLLLIQQLTLNITNVYNPFFFRIASAGRYSKAVLLPTGFEFPSIYLILENWMLIYWFNWVNPKICLLHPHPSITYYTYLLTYLLIWHSTLQLCIFVCFSGKAIKSGLKDSVLLFKNVPWRSNFYVILLKVFYLVKKV